MTEVATHTDIVKVGNGVLTEKGEDGSICFNEEAFREMGDEISEAGNTVLVSSVAITAGMMLTGMRGRPDPETEMPELQRMATIGWREVHNMWDRAITARATGALLLTRQELGIEDSRCEALHTIEALLRHGDVPVINENDGIAHDEIAFGSNDILAAHLAARMQESEMFGTVRLYLLTDVDGVYKDKDDPDTRIPIIANTDEYRHLANDTDDPELKIGGMASKFDAADIAKAAGVDMWIYNPADGQRDRALNGGIGTYFPA